MNLRRSITILNKNDPFYTERLNQLLFVDWAANVIREILKQPLTNESLSGILQITNHRSGEENVYKYLERNISDKNKLTLFINEFKKMNLTGFTTSSKGSVNRFK